MRVLIHRFFRAPMVAVALLTITACGSDTTEETREPVIRPIKLLTLSAAPELETARYPAVVSAGRFGELSFQVGGLIEELGVVEAQEVNVGDVIARLNQRDFKSNVVQALAQFEAANDEYQRTAQLAQKGAVALSVLQQREAQRDVARAQLDTAEKALEDTVLYAPFKGVVASVPTREQENIVAGQLIAALIDTDILEVTIDLPARSVAESLEVEDRGSVVILEAAPEAKIAADFKEAKLLADTVSQTYAVTYSFVAPSNLVILPGMSATVELSTARTASTATGTRKSVPLSAISSDGASNYVWVVDPDKMTVSKREVTIANGVGEFVVVTEGLARGETIATAGASFLSDGMQIRAWKE